MVINTKEPIDLSSPTGGQGAGQGAAIIGGAGYTGGELLRLLIHHSQISISFVHSRSNGGQKVSSVHPDLLGETDLTFTSELSFSNHVPDVLFLCVGHGEAKKFLAENDVPASVRIIDLSQDFRLAANAIPGERAFVYGLPEANKAAIQTARNIANPGCFATAIQLGLLPLAKVGLLGTVHATGITGSTGAGQSLSATSHFSWRANNIQAYKTLTHQHLAEVMQTLKQLQGSHSGSTLGDGGLRFVPWRGDFTRGIFVSSMVDCALSLEEAMALYNDFYAGAAFTFVSTDAISLKQVINTNKCVIGLEKDGTTLVIHSAIDNLLKGACGQAVQNMNLMLGLDEKAGLNLKPVAF